MAAPVPRFALESDDNARRSPVRLVVVQGDREPAVDGADADLVMTFPHLVIRELIALLLLSLGLVALAIFFDAPLEEIANPAKTPNPAKAPWYFLGLQELLHYYPPIFSGVLLPGIVIVCLVVIPYFDINLKREAFWKSRTARKLLGLWTAVAVTSAIFLLTGSHPVWPIVGPLWCVGGAMTLPALVHRSSGALGWLGDRSLAFWIFTWFALSAITLTVIGVAFRGPGWAFTLPWRDGLY
jgi:quinol---cytochrome c reductase cytochrome c subunit, bacillus type